MAVDQRVAQAEVLRHARHGVIDGAVAVGVILTQHFTDDTGALLVGRAWVQAHIVHGVEDAAVHRLEAIARIREGAGHDHAHGVVEIGSAHLLFDQHGPDIAAAAAAVVAIGAVRAIHPAAAAAACACHDGTVAGTGDVGSVIAGIIRQAALQVVALVVKDIVEVLGDRALACIIKLVHGLVLQLVVQLAVHLVRGRSSVPSYLPSITPKLLASHQIQHRIISQVGRLSQLHHGTNVRERVRENSIFRRGILYN